MDDLISRQAAIDALEREKSLVERPITETRWFDFGLRKAQEVLSELPSAQAERKKGKWIKHERGYWTFVNKDGERDGWIPDYECSECGSRGWKYADDTMNFCPNCGAKMRGEQDG